MAEKFDTEQIKHSVALADYAARRGVTLKKDGREWKGCCPFHSEKTPSFTVYPSREGFQKFQCFGCGASGNVIDFVQEFDGVTFPEACEILGGTREAPTRERAPLPPVETSDPYAGFEYLTPPDDAPAILKGKRTPQLRNPKRETENGEPKFATYTPSWVSPYRAADGSVLGYILVVDLEGGKITPLIRWARKGDWEGWTHGTFAEPRPLHGLDRSAANPDGQWFVLEGEWKTDVAANLFPDMVAISWQGGCKAYAKSDWSQANGRSVLNWMDNDDEGERAMLGFWKADAWVPGVVEIQLRAGAKKVKVIGRDHSKPKGWDLKDAVLKDGWTRQEILAYAKDKAKVWTLKTIEERKASLKKSAPVIAPPGADSPAGEITPSPATPVSRPQMKVLAGGQAVARSAPVERVAVRRDDSGVVHLYSTPRAIDDSVDMPLKERFENDDKGTPRKKSLHNFIATSRYHPHMEGVLAWDDFSGRVMLMKCPPWMIACTEVWEPRKIESEDDLLAAAWFSKAVFLQPNEKECSKAMRVAAKMNRVNPVKDYLEALKWDGTRRVQGEANLDPWLAEYLGARATKINQAFGMRWLIAAVARVYQPGCKVDTMLVFEGGQGKGKSTALRTLATIDGQDYFTDSLHDFKGKDAVQQMTGKWIAEIPELDAMWRSEASTVKAFITRQVDSIRIPYEAHVEDFPRTSILAGTVNPSGTGYLKDTTGNRRFWPVLVGNIDIARLAADREQIWAEAVHLYKQGEQWWLTDDEEALARVEQEKRQEREPWADAIDEFLIGKSRTTVDSILIAINVPRAQWNTKTSNRVVDHLQSVGWKKKRLRENGQLKYFYVPADQTDD